MVINGVQNVHCQHSSTLLIHLQHCTDDLVIKFAPLLDQSLNQVIDVRDGSVYCSLYMRSCNWPQTA